jgi:hypothetical protein
MIKTGILLLISSSLGVLYRQADLAYSALPSLRWFCFSGLLIAFTCFVATYVKYALPRRAKPIEPGPDMIKSPAWKLSSET